MKTAATFVEWGCEQLWTINEGVDYPHLVWEDLPGVLLDEGWFAGGAGTEEDPYLIDAAEQLQFIDTVPCLLGCSFKVIADIDLSAYDGQGGRPIFNVIGDYDAPFTGVFDGDGHVISNFTYISENSDCLGIFGYTNSAIIRNLGVSDANVDAGSGERVGGIVGNFYFHSEIENCYVKGGTVSGYRMVGGLVGRNDGYDCLVRNCWTSVDVQGTSYVGGLVGDNFSSDIYYSYATGSVNGHDRIGGLAGEHSYDRIVECFAMGDVIGDSTSVYLGGLVGYTRGFPLIESCYATGAVNGRAYVGGLIGENNDDGYVYDCYAVGNVSALGTAGGLIGRKDPDVFVSNSFWDTNTTGQLTSDGGIGLTTADMQNANTFINAGWDFIDEAYNGMDDTWRLCNQGTEYPLLNWQFARGDIVCPEGVDTRDLSTLCEQWLLEKLTCEVDFQRDRGIDFLDWSIFAAAWQSTPSSPKWNPKCDIAPEAGDEKVDIKDMAAFIEQWLKTGSYYLNADIAPVPNGDDIVNMFDFAAFAENWLVDFE
jgi:hypothetical protein